MKNIKITFLAAGALLMGLSSCSTTETATTENNTDATAETVTTNEPESQVRAGETGVGNTETGTMTDAERADMALDTTSFAVMAASSDMFEKLSSQEAQRKATNAEVKRFATMMIEDHYKTSTELTTLAAKKNIQLPAGPVAMHQRMLRDLANEDAKEFDEEYMEAQVLAHQTAVTLYETAAKGESDAELKAFAAKTLPALKMHLTMAKKIKDMVD